MTDLYRGKQINIVLSPLGADRAALTHSLAQRLDSHIYAYFAREKTNIENVISLTPDETEVVKKYENLDFIFFEDITIFNEVKSKIENPLYIFFIYFGFGDYSKDIPDGDFISLARPVNYTLEILDTPITLKQHAIVGLTGSLDCALYTFPDEELQTVLSGKDAYSIEAFSPKLLALLDDIYAGWPTKQVILTEEEPFGKKVLERVLTEERNPYKADEIIILTKNSPVEKIKNVKRVHVVNAEISTFTKHFPYMYSPGVAIVVHRTIDKIGGKIDTTSEGIKDILENYAKMSEYV